MNFLYRQLDSIVNDGPTIHLFVTIRELEFGWPTSPYVKVEWITAPSTFSRYSIEVSLRATNTGVLGKK